LPYRFDHDDVFVVLFEESCDAWLLLEMDELLFHGGVAMYSVVEAERIRIDGSVK
jgi:hypothetical protein